MALSDDSDGNYRVLLTFVGNHDPRGADSDECGPVLSLLEARNFEQVVVYCTGHDYVERARAVQAEAEAWGFPGAFSFVDLELESVIDYAEIYPKLRDLTLRALASIDFPEPEVFILLDPGTPQMQTSWFLLARSGAVKARLLQGVPRHFAGGAYKVREVDLDGADLPQVTIADYAIKPESPVVLFQPDWHEPHVESLYKLDGLGTTEDTGSAATERGRAGVEWFVADLPAFTVRDGAMLELFGRAARVAAYDNPILLLGEMGVGKDVLARFIQARSRRSDAPFVVLNCAAIPRELVESELFGHARGAFTGAERERLGKFRSADGGTLFLDEIGDLPLEVQPKLLRALEQGSITPVGSDIEIKADVRLIAATNRDLSSMARSGAFRADLLGRVSGIELRIPPLRERRSEIEPLAKGFLEAWNGRYGEEKRFAPGLLGALEARDWPGNVRELRNAVERMAAVALGDELGQELLEDSGGGPVARRSGGTWFSPELLPDRGRIPESGMDLRAWLYAAEREFFREALERAGGKRERAAALLGLKAPAFRKALRERFSELSDPIVDE
ncbi:MAG: sigma 54-interacting transcriptional regulator [Spirochaetales bacterium]|nr:sigma 54-interacting transcriptional regulator [Spirochaetales bacterium]